MSQGSTYRQRFCELAHICRMDAPQVVEAFRSGVPDASAFTGGSTHDEFASLVALAHRVRIAVGAPGMLPGTVPGAMLAR